MELMIQNNTQHEVNFPFYTNGTTGVSTDKIQLAPNTVSAVSEELYEKVLMNSRYFQVARSKGEISVLSGSGVDNGIKENKRNEDALYGGYCELMSKIKEMGGLRSKDIAQFLDGDGMPTMKLLKAQDNIGNAIDEVVANRFKNRYNIECRNGLHESSVKLPGGSIASGVKDDAGVSNKETREDANRTYTENELIAMGLDEVRKIADSRGVPYRANSTTEAIAKKIVESQSN